MSKKRPKKDAANEYRLYNPDAPYYDDQPEAETTQSKKTTKHKK
ncbi:hypothetical protein [Lentibacillus saliphilus]|nr:hypothetical protein [Lentibacillus saliphilus]